MEGISVFTTNEKLDLAYDKILDVIDEVIKEYQLSYYEIFGILKSIDTDLIKANMEEE